MKFITAVNPNPQTQQPITPPSWESIGVITSAILGISAVIGLIVRATSKFNQIDNSIRDLKEDLKNHQNTEGHDKVILKIEAIQKQLVAHDKAFDVHLSNYQNRNETLQFTIGQVAQTVTHTRESGKAELKEAKTEIKELEVEMKELQQYLQKHLAFAIREREK